MNSTEKPVRIWRLGLIFASLVSALAIVGLALAFAEEPLSFRDPNTGEEVPGQEISSIHFDLTYALAIAAGFTVTDSVRL